MRVTRIQLLRFLGCAALLLGFVPLLALCTSLFGRAPSENLPRLAFLLAAGLAGFYFHGMLQRRTAFSLFLRGTCLAGTALLCGLGTLLFADGAGEGLVLFLLFAAGHLWGARFSRRSFDELLGDRTFWKMLALYGVFLVTPAAVNYFYPIVYSQLLNAVCFLCFVTLHLLLHNQANIDSLTASRHYSLEALPKRIRAYNVVLVAGIVLLIAGLFTALYLCMPDLSELARRLKEWLIGLLSGGPLPEEAAETPLPEGNGMQDALSGLGEENDSLAWLGKLLQILFGGLLVVGVAAVIVYNRSSIAGALRRFWQRLSELLSAFFRRAAQYPRREETADYTDYDQTVAVETEKEHTGGSQSRKWRKAVRQYHRMEDSAEKYRTGYGLAVSGLILCGAGIREADTPLEIAGKASGLLDGGQCRTATEFFDLLQYGGRAYQPGRTETLDDILQEVSALQRKKSGRR